ARGRARPPRAARGPARARRACGARPASTAILPPSPRPGSMPSACRAPSRRCLQIAPQTPARPMQIDLHLIRAQPENPRTCGAVEALHVDQDHEAALRLGQARDLAAQPIAELELLHVP